MNQETTMEDSTGPAATPRDILQVYESNARKLASKPSAGKQQKRPKLNPSESSELVSSSTAPTGLGVLGGVVATIRQNLWDTVATTTTHEAQSPLRIIRL
ncbi:hypothetical protein WJX84_003606 [Apatococcus fuscideae]|uniref:Uncharacterized protein n=1 Tax=Apatococcus fuscideae TaxID=2026836 RepID=A0AAW1TBT7_9CHLO